MAQWQARAGEHCQQVHEHLVQQGQVDLGHVQADELWVKMVGKRVWIAMALAVPSRLWLGGVISPHRDCALIAALVQKVRACARNLAILVCVDGLASYVTAFLKAACDAPSAVWVRELAILGDTRPSALPRAASRDATAR